MIDSDSIPVSLKEHGKHLVSLWHQTQREWISDKPRNLGQEEIWQNSVFTILCTSILKVQNLGLFFLPKQSIISGCGVMLR